MSGFSKKSKLSALGVCGISQERDFSKMLVRLITRAINVECIMEKIFCYERRQRPFADRFYRYILETCFVSRRVVEKPLRRITHALWEIVVFLLLPT